MGHRAGVFDQRLHPTQRLRQNEHPGARAQRLGQDASGLSWRDPISALVTEAEDNIKDAADQSILDITLIASAQQVEHHEMAVYGTLRTWAELLGEDNAADVLESILDEEKKADDEKKTDDKKDEKKSDEKPKKVVQ